MFSQAIETRLRMAKSCRLKMLRPMTRSRHVFSLIATYNLVPTAANKYPRSKRRVYRTIRRYRRDWLRVLEQLCVHELWSPTTNVTFDAGASTFDESRFDFAFGLCTRCLPLCVKWHESKTSVLRRNNPKKRKINAHIIPCRKTHFCPACFGSLSEQQYRHVKKTLNGLNKQGVPVTLTTRVTSVSVPAAVGIDPEHEQTRYLQENVRRLRDAVMLAKERRQKMHKRLQRNTLGSYWRVLAVPVPGGWRLETRWVFITDYGKAPPIDDISGSTVQSEHTVALPEKVSWRERLTESPLDENLVTALIPFAKYPRELLTGDVDLIAAWLNAIANTRIIVGTGLLEKAGRSLLTMHKQHDRKTALKKKQRRGKKAKAKNPVA